MKKEELRKINKQKRKELSLCEVKEKSEKAFKNFINSDIYKNAKVIMLYYPIGNETDTSYLFEKAVEDNKTVVFPVTDIETNEMTAVMADKNTKFSKGGYSVFEPCDKKEFDKKLIDVVIVPGIAFDKIGFRVGFGKGCYDRFLDKTNAIKVGYCYDFQIVETILKDSFDIKMDYLVSESGMVVCE